MFNIKYFTNFLLYFLISSSSLGLVFSGTNPVLRVRSITNTNVSRPWLLANYLDSFKEVPITNKKSEIYFEFQDVTSNKIYPSEKYTFWRYEDIYKDYVFILNGNLLKSN